MRELLEKLIEEGVDLLTIQQRTHVPLKVLINPEESSTQHTNAVLRLYDEVIGDPDEE